MAKQVIGIGTTANDGTGDSLRVSVRSQTTTLLRFTLFWVMVLPCLLELLPHLQAGTNVTLSGSTGNVTINASITGGSTAEVSEHIGGYWSFHTWCYYWCNFPWCR